MTSEENLIKVAAANELFAGLDQAGELVLSSDWLRFSPSFVPVLRPYELLLLAAIVRARKPRRILELGTALGHVTYILAANSPGDARVVTVDLPVDQRDDYARACLHGESRVGTAYVGTQLEPKIVEVASDTRAVAARDLVAEYGPMDLVLVDANHERAFVDSDSELAANVTHDASLILWHDFYTFPDYVADRDKRGVFPVLNDWARRERMTLRQIIGTYLVAGSPTWNEDLPGRARQPGEPEGRFGQRIVRMGETT